MNLISKRTSLVLLVAIGFFATGTASALPSPQEIADGELALYQAPSVLKAARYSFADHTRALSAQMILGQGQRTAETLEARAFARRNGVAATAMRTSQTSMFAAKDATPLDVLASVKGNTAPAQSGLALWGSFYGGSSRYQDHDGRNGFQACTYGAIIGAEYDMGDDFLIGFMVAHERSRLKFGTGSSANTTIGLLYIIDEMRTETGGNASLETLRFGPYASKQFGKWFVNGSITAGLHKAKYQRGMLSEGTQTGSITGTLYNSWSDSETVKGSYNAWDLAFSGSVGRDIQLSDNDLLTPYAALTYNYIQQDGFTESGDISISRKFGSTQETALTSYLGARYHHNGDLFGMPVALSVNAAWAHQCLFGDEKQSGRGTVTNLPYGPSQRLGSTNNDYIVYGASLDMPLCESTSLSVGYNGQYGSDHITHFGSVQLHVAL
ncbi:MAG: autotransporter outer membrane beta-barrel domain-containing protein [Phycisphaerales bacterium]|nr:autotransporter outer membrane beta-barrel domain-containing protein [Phycisphaerales bacterium]MBT7170951.1 autotransporter outer membrane beta-barrel domain-containing protein [Phycisphaerales bacterium]